MAGARGPRPDHDKKKRALDMSKWAEAIRTHHEGEEATAKMIDELMPGRLREGAKRPTSLRGNMIAEAVRKGVLQEVEKGKTWRVLPPTGKPDSGGTTPSSNGGSSERDPDDVGQLEHMPEDKFEAAQRLLLLSFEEKGGNFTFLELQKKCKFFRDFSWSAIRHFLVNLKKGEKKLANVKKNPNPMRKGKDLFCLTGDGKAELVYLRKQEADKAASMLTKNPQKKEKMQLPVLPGQEPVQGEKPAGFSADLILCQEAQKLFRALAGEVDVVTRGLFKLAMRWKYCWGDSVSGVAVGRVVCGLIGDDGFGVVTWVNERNPEFPDKDPTAHNDDILVLSAQTKSASKKVSSKPSPKLVSKPASKQVGSTELEALREQIRLLTVERDEIRAQTEKLQAQRHHWLDRVRVDLEKSFGLTPEDFAYLAASQDSES